MLSEEEPAGGEPAPPALEEAENERLIGQTLGGCLVEKLLYRDPMSCTYKATQVSMERVVTLKVLAREMTKDEQAVSRFIEAARAAGKLAHPNIVQVYDAGKEDGLYYIALEHVDGKTVKSILLERSSARPLEMEKALDIAEQISAALEHAHKHGIVHRRIRLENILITDQGVAKLADLGFGAGLIEAGIKEHLLPGQRMLDLQLTAPEGIETSARADFRSDIYSLGAVLFAMATGRLPFRGRTEGEIVEKIKNGQRIPLERLNQNLPEKVQHLILKAMAPRPEDRYQNAAAMRADVLTARAAQR